MQRLRESFEESHAAYLARLAAGTQPVPPALVRSAAGGALRFLDYTDDVALLRVNAAYLVVIAVLYVIMRWRGTGFELRGPMIVRAARHFSCGSRELGRAVRRALARLARARARTAPRPRRRSTRHAVASSRAGTAPARRRPAAAPARAATALPAATDWLRAAPQPY
jgi:hypothetical protein